MSKGCRLSDDQMQAAVKCAEQVAREQAQYPLRKGNQLLIAEALLSATALLAKYEAVVGAARAKYAAKCGLSRTKCGDPNTGAIDGTHDWLCPVDVAERGLIDALAAVAEGKTP